MLHRRSTTRAFGISELAFLLLMCLLAGCRQDDGPHRYTRFAMGTVVDYVIVGVDEDVARAAVDMAHFEVERVASLLWEGDPSSETFRINSSCGSGSPGSTCDATFVSEETARFLSRALSYGDETGGAFDVTVGSFLPFYDFAAESPVAPDTVGVRKLAAVLGEQRRDLAIGTVQPSGYPEDSAYARLSGLRSGVRIAVGGVAKGYAVDRAVQVLKEAGIRSALVNAGGDLYCIGTNEGEPWRIGIQNPDDAGSVIAAVDVVDAAVATSGDYQQYIEVGGIRYHHLLEPSTGLPARRARSATIVAASAERADALATGLFVVGAGGLGFVEQALDTEGLLVDLAGDRHETTGMSRFRVAAIQ